MPAAPARSHPEPPGFPRLPGRRATWWQQHEASLQAAAAVVVVALLTMVWWWVAGSKPAAEATLLTDRDGRQPNLALLPPELRDAVNRTVREGRLQFAPVPPELQPRGGEPRSGPAAFLPLSPVGVTVRARQPSLRWTSGAGATGYVVRLRHLHPDDPAVPPAASPELPGTRTEWTPPEPLVPGETYAWQVEARRDEPGAGPRPAITTPEAHFQVLDEARRGGLDEVERRFGRFPLIMAVALARAGLTDEAAGRLAELTREHPQSNAALRLQRGAEATRMRGRELER